MDAVTETRVRPRTLGLALIPVEKVPELAPRVFDLVDRACSFSGGRFDAASVIEGCAGANPNWHPQLWVSGYSGGGEPPTLDSVAITAIANYPTGLRVLEVILVAGEGSKSWLQFEEDFTGWGRRQGCQRLQMIGRRGWARTLPHWKQAAQMFERVIEARDGDG